MTQAEESDLVERAKERIAYFKGPHPSGMTFPGTIAVLEDLIAEIARLRAEFDANVERVKACEHIAEGEEGWQLLRNLCPSAAAVATLRDEYTASRAAIEALVGAAEPLLADLSWRELADDYDDISVRALDLRALSRAVEDARGALSMGAQEADGVKE